MWKSCFWQGFFESSPMGICLSQKAEIDCLGQLQHANLVKLIGYCLKDDHRLLVYEFMTKGSIYRITYSEPLSWSIRMSVALGAVKGLAFLHSTEPKVIYRDFKTSNMLLDSNYNAKLSDFGLSRNGPTDDRSHVSTRVMGTYGYAAPEYLSTGHFKAKSDVYSLGVVVIELLSGRRTIDMNRPSGEQNLVDGEDVNHKRKIFRIIDVRLEGQHLLTQALKAGNLAHQCLSPEPKLRPYMEEVVDALVELQDLNNTEKNGE